MAMGKNEFAQAVILGQIHWGRLLNILNHLPKNIKYDTCAQPCSWAPPRIRFWASDEQDLIRLAEELKVEWQNWPTKFQIPSIEGVKTHFQKPVWTYGLISTGESVTFFSPYHLQDFRYCTHRVERLRKTVGQFLLATQKQSYGTLEFYLLNTAKECRLKLSAWQRQWGRWLSYTSTAEEFYKKLFRSRREYNKEISIAIPYDKEKGLLAFPAALVPPMPVARILCRCSGLLPFFVKWHDLYPAIKGLDTDGIDTFDSPFFFPTKDSAIIYRNIPYPVAAVIGSKLGIEIKNTELRNMEEVL
jgi:hypothetical protein